MEERQLLEEEERRQEQIEALLDVRKQKNLSGFYTNVLKMRSGEFVIHEESEKEKIAKVEEALKKKNEPSVKSTHAKVYRTQKEESSEEESEVKKEPEICPEDKDEIISDEDEPTTEVNKPGETVKKDKDKEEEDKKLEIKIEIESLKQEEILTNQKIDKEEKRINMFKKRTVNEVFDSELSEYFIRKSNVLSLKTYIERD
jgi:coiled-coil domain-containing protein 55